MAYQTTITQKGQITIPKAVRDALNLTQTKKVYIEYQHGDTTAKIIPSYDFFDVAKKIHIKKRTNPIKAREYLETSYERP